MNKELIEKIENLKIKLIDLEEKINSLENNNSLLERFLGYMSNQSFLEKEARLRLNYKVPGEEVVFVYPDDSAKTSSSSNNFEKQLAQMPNYIKWVYYLMGY